MGTASDCPSAAVADSLAFGFFFHNVHQHSGVDKRMDSSRSDRQMDVLIEYSVSSPSISGQSDVGGYSSSTPSAAVLFFHFFVYDEDDDYDWLYNYKFTQRVASGCMTVKGDAANELRVQREDMGGTRTWPRAMSSFEQNL